MPNTTDEHEQALVQQAIDDPDAFQTLYHRYARRVYGYIASRIAHPQDVEDVVAEVFLRVIKHLDQLRNRQQASFAAWLFVIARHAVADHYRHNGRHECLLSLEDAEPCLSVEKQPDHIFSENEEAARLYRMILNLPERQREIVTLRYYGDLHNQEIAAVLGIGEKTVSAYLSRALSDLQKKYSTAQSAEGQASDE
jgi:RNA polymerase sigma factor (sigma-70 family)